jgi:hypothetical protein
MPSGGAAVHKSAMKILLVSYFFAPANTMGALRLSRLATFLMRRGHDVRVLAAADPGPPPTLDCDFPDERALRTAQLDINWLPRRLAALRATRRRVPANAAIEASDAGAARRGGPQSRKDAARACCAEHRPFTPTPSTGPMRAPDGCRTPGAPASGCRVPGARI